MSPRRPPRIEPVHCICEPGGVAHAQHGKPGKKAAAHLNPKCPHSELTNTTRPLPKKRTVPRLRIV